MNTCNTNFLIIVCNYYCIVQLYYITNNPSSALYIIYKNKPLSSVNIANQRFSR